MKKRKLIILILLIFFLVAAGVGGCFVYSQRVRAAVSNQDIALEEGQELLYAKITSISGNEMDYAVLEARAVELEEIGNGAAQDIDGRPSGGEMPSGGGGPSGGGRSSNSEMPSGGGEPSGGGRPSNSEMLSGGGRLFNGGMPSGDQNGNAADGGMPSDKQNGNASGEKPTTDVQDRTLTTYMETGKTGQIQIPVGTDVETKLGTITTFSRLSNGDTIRMLLQKVDNGGKELLKIWIVE